MYTITPPPALYLASCRRPRLDPGASAARPILAFLTDSRVVRGDFCRDDAPHHALLRKYPRPEPSAASYSTMGSRCARLAGHAAGCRRRRNPRCGHSTGGGLRSWARIDTGLGATSIACSSATRNAAPRRHSCGVGRGSALEVRDMVAEVADVTIAISGGPKWTVDQRSCTFVAGRRKIQNLRSAPEKEARGPVRWVPTVPLHYMDAGGTGCTRC